ncbi:hypothetical protein EBU95_17070 [bacterium]|nr:hypothetical protein [bacterium]
MTYSTFIHSGIVNPKSTSIPEDKKQIEVVVIEYKLLAEILRQAGDGHSIDTLLEKIKNLKDTGILNKQAHGEAFDLEKSNDDKTLESIRKLAGT